MKKTLNQLVLSMIVCLSCLTACTKEGPAGKDGKDGNANVKTFYINGSFQLDGQKGVLFLACSAITNKFLEKGIVLVYMGDKQLPMSFSTTKDVTTFYEVAVSEGNVKLTISNSDNSSPFFPTTMTYKVVLVDLAQ